MLSQKSTKSLTINCKGKLYDLSTPKIMGIINCTPDSFYEKSRLSIENDILGRVQSMIDEGVDIIDVGGASTRPGAIFPSAKEEKDRVIHVVKLIRENFPDLLISIDTMYSEVAQEAINVGADIINDVSGGELDPQILEVAAKNKTPYVLTHSPGFIKTTLPFESENFMLDLISYLSTKILECKTIGIKDIIIDPGFGFAKTVEQNFEIIKKNEMLQVFEFPVLVGVSRKSMIYKTLNISVESSLNGTTILNTLLYKGGANIIRVHDVNAVREIRTLLSMC